MVGEALAAERDELLRGRGRPARRGAYPRRDADDDDGTEDLNVNAVLLDTAADAAAAAGVAVSGATILAAGGWYWLDPATALVIAVIVGYHALKLRHKIAVALRSRSPVLSASHPRSDPD